MYEKPQYLTPDGYKRASQNPYGKETNVLTTLRAQRAALLKQQAALEAPAQNGVTAPLRLLNQRPKKKTLDEKSARLIAEAIKSMLHSK